MPELRWILLIAGIALIAGLYALGVRARRRSVSVDPERATRLGPARPAVAPQAPSGTRVEPPSWVEDPFEDPSIADEATDEALTDAQPVASPAEPAAPSSRREPRREPRLEDSTEVQPAESEATPPATPASAQSADETKRAPAQKIVAVRIVAPAAGMFDGASLREAIAAEGFQFGRYQIFHRLDSAGRPLCSLASLREPGTFEPDAMAGTEFRGVAMFTVLPGPLQTQLALDALVGTARLLAERLGAEIQDDRGAPLTLQRIAQLRDDVARFERSRSELTAR